MECKHLLCEEFTAECHFEVIICPSGTAIHDFDMDTHLLIFCQSGHVHITSTFFHDEILCAGEVMFIPRMSECSGTALSEATLLVHKFNNTVCRAEKCILSNFYSHRRPEIKNYCYKLDVSAFPQIFLKSISSYIRDGVGDSELWQLKHKELIWIFIRFYAVDELRSFFHSIADEQIPFRSQVLTHYRKAEFTDKLAEMCGYGLHNFRRIFKKEFGMSPYKWLMMKRAEHIKYRLLQEYIPFADIIDEFRFSSPAHFSNFCKRFLGDTPTNIRKTLSEKEING